MTVKELISELEKFDGDKEVKYDSEVDGTCYSITRVEFIKSIQARGEFVLIL